MLALFLSERHDFRGQLLLISVENVFRLVSCAATKGMDTGRKSDTEDNDILAAGVRSGQNIPQVIESVRISYCNKNVSRADTNQAVIKRRIVEHSKLFQRIRLASLLTLSVTFGDGEDSIRKYR